LNLEGISVSKAFLFGSYSNGTASDSSDIDIMIISDKYDENDDEIIGKIWKLTRKINTKIEPILIGEKKFYDESVSPLISMVKANGIEIV
jgi:predicted nucleotidyltransferase